MKIKKIRAIINYEEEFDFLNKEIRESFLFWKFGDDYLNHNFEELTDEDIKLIAESIVFCNVDSEHCKFII